MCVIFLSCLCVTMVTVAFTLPPKTPVIVSHILTYHSERVMDWIVHLEQNNFKEALKDFLSTTDTHTDRRIRIHFVKNEKINMLWSADKSTFTMNTFYLDKLLKHLMTEHIQKDIMTRMSVRRINDQTSIIGVYAIRDIPENTFPFKTLLGYCFAENPTIEINKNTQEIQEVRSFLDEFFLGTDEYPLPVLGPNSINVSYFLNHSDTPNIVLDTVDECEYTVYKTSRPIKKGEELTIDYNDFVSKERPFHTIQEQLDPTGIYLSEKKKRSRLI